MEVMEEGNLMDRVPILLERDMQYYQEKQVVLQETICSGVVGGKLDFPRYASFASVKIVLWWEDEYFAAYRKNSGLLNLHQIDEDGEFMDIDNTAGCGGVVKNSDPEKFVMLIAKSADSLLEHLHTLSQEALDHADLSVLTATIGAAALVKNSLWVYLQCTTTKICPPKGDDKGGSLKMCYKQYSEMTEALAERLLDLHCRLLSLYIIQDADCLHWENQQPFFESERGSFCIQMWWCYMQGTKQDLWNSVPPNMAQRVLSGMLNDTLTTLTVRYTQTVPSKARSQLLLVDVSNILLCVAELLPSICENGEAFVGLNIVNQSKVVRDIHAKCQELFQCLLLRGVSLGVLYKVLRKGPGSLGCFTPRQNLPVPWLVFAMPKLFPNNQSGHWSTRCSDFNANTAIALELKVLLGAPQANWALLLKVLLMREAMLSTQILHYLIKLIPSSDSFVTSLEQPTMKQDNAKCDGFLCGRECNDMDMDAKKHLDPVGQTNYQVVLAMTYVLCVTGKTSDLRKTLISALDKCQIKDWASCLDRRQVWVQKRAPWLEAILHFVYPVIPPIIHMIVTAFQGGATVYQTMALSLSCFSEMWDCIPDCFYVVTSLLSEIIPADIRPLGDSVLIHILFSALYTKILESSQSAQALEEEAGEVVPSTSSGSDTKSKVSICTTLAEAICSIDEDNKHTDQINTLINKAKDSQRTVAEGEEFENITGISLVSTSKADDLEQRLHSSPSTRCEEEYDVENAVYIADVLISDVLTSHIGKQSMKMIYKYIRNNVEWLYQLLGVSNLEPNPVEPNQGQNLECVEPNLLKIMFHINHQPFDQLLTGQMHIDYGYWLQMPMSLTPERSWLQVSQRHEFQEGSATSVHEVNMVAHITNQLKPLP